MASCWVADLPEAAKNAWPKPIAPSMASEFTIEVPRDNKEEEMAVSSFSMEA